MQPDILVLIVGVFVTFMAVWATVVYGLMLAQRRRRDVADREPGLDSAQSQPEPTRT